MLIVRMSFLVEKMMYPDIIGDYVVFHIFQQLYYEVVELALISYKEFVKLPYNYDGVITRVDNFYI